MSFVSELNASGLSHRCSKEQRLFLSQRPHDPRYCYELFRRALQNQDQIAWKLVIEIFGPLVTGWVKNHGNFPHCREEIQYVVQGAFVRFWSALSGSRFNPSKNLDALLLYLKRCVHSEIVDLLRREVPPALTLTDNLPQTNPTQVDPIAVEKLWAFVRSILKDDKERIVVYATFFLAYTPREIHASYPTSFKSVQEVHRIKENVFARLRRAEGFKEYLDFDD